MRLHGPPPGQWPQSACRMGAAALLRVAAGPPPVSAVGLCKGVRLIGKRLQWPQAEKMRRCIRNRPRPVIGKEGTSAISSAIIFRRCTCTTGLPKHEDSSGQAWAIGPRNKAQNRPSRHSAGKCSCDHKLKFEITHRTHIRTSHTIRRKSPFGTAHSASAMPTNYTS